MKQEMIFLCLMGLRLKTWTVFSTVGRSDKSYIFFIYRFMHIHIWWSLTNMEVFSSHLQFNHLCVSPDETRVYQITSCSSYKPCEL